MVLKSNTMSGFAKQGRKHFIKLSRNLIDQYIMFDA